MMTTEYCPATKIQRMEQELWTLTLKGDDIEAYSNRFHELVLMCPELVSTESKKIEKYIRGFPKRIKGNITSSKPATLHEAINMARELVEQSVQGRAARIGESNKRKWEDNQRNNNNNNHNYNNNHNNNKLSDLVWTNLCIRQTRIHIEQSDYRMEIKSLPFKVKCGGNALSRKKKDIKAKTIRAMVITIHSGLKVQRINGSAEQSF
ncbi:putative reverse transcriptase domain-containing protein [Tanacetum coccineum]